MNLFEHVNKVLQGEKTGVQRATTASKRPRLTVGTKARIAVEGNAPIQGGEILIVPEGQGDPKATPARFACNAEFVRVLERAGIGGRIELGQGARTYTVELVEIHDETTH